MWPVDICFNGGAVHYYKKRSNQTSTLHCGGRTGRKLKSPNGLKHGSAWYIGQKYHPLFTLENKLKTIKHIHTKLANNFWQDKKTLV